MREAATTAAGAREPRTIHSTFVVNIAHPPDGDWKALSGALKALRSPLHKAMNAVMLDLELEARRRNEELLRSWQRKPAKSARAKPVPMQTLAYRLMSTHWAAERQRALADAEKHEGELRAFLIAVAESSPAGAVVLGAAGEVFARWRKWNKERIKGAVSIPSFKREQPIRVCSSSHAVQIFARDGNAILSLSLLEGRQGRRELVVTPAGPGDAMALRCVMEAPGALGDAKIIQKDNGGWKVHLSWHHDVVAGAPGGGTMAIHRGVRSFLTAATVGGGERGKTKNHLWFEDGVDIVRHIAAHTARRRSLGRHSKQLGAGAYGHGRNRRFDHITKLEDADARWKRTKCQEAAAHAIKFMRRAGATRLLLEDWSNPAADTNVELPGPIQYLVRSFPLAMLRDMLERAAHRAGFEVEMVDGAFVSRDCPLCAHRHDAPPIAADALGVRRVFMCAACQFEEDVDRVAAWNLLIRDGHREVVHRAIREEQERREEFHAKVKLERSKSSAGAAPAGEGD